MGPNKLKPKKNYTELIPTYRKVFLDSNVFVLGAHTLNNKIYIK